MIIQEPSTDILQLVTGSAGSIQCLTSWVDNNSGVMAPGGGNFSISTATTTNISPAPAAGNYRALQFALVRNGGATQTVTLQHTDGTTVVPIWSGSLKAGRSLILNELGQVSMLDENNVPINGSTNALVKTNWVVNSYTNAVETTLVTGPAVVDSVVIGNMNGASSVFVELLLFSGSTQLMTIVPPTEITVGAQPIRPDIPAITLTAGQTLKARANTSGAEFYAGGLG